MNLQPIFALFDTAVSHKLKYPKIRLNATDGRVVVLKLAGSKSKYTGQLMVTDDRPFGSNTYYGRISQDGVFQASSFATPAVVNLLHRLAANPAEVASEYGKLTGNCAFCDLKLTDARSTAVGYGPICADHYGLPWGNDFRAPRGSEARSRESAIIDREFTVIAESPADSSKPVELFLADPSVPVWAKDVIRVALTKDVLEAANILSVLADRFAARARQHANGNACANEIVLK